MIGGMIRSLGGIAVVQRLGQGPLGVLAGAMMST